MDIDLLMNTNIRTCRADDSAKRAAGLMWDADIGSLPVVDASGRPIGMITDRDLLMAAHFTGKSLDALCVLEAMSKQVYVARAGGSLQNASELMRLKQVRRLPVVDSSGRLIGIVSVNDFALAGGRSAELNADVVVTTLASICQPRRNAGP